MPRVNTSRPFQHTPPQFVDLHVFFFIPLCQLPLLCFKLGSKLMHEINKYQRFPKKLCLKRDSRAENLKKEAREK